jgi:hypothetical protein
VEAETVSTAVSVCEGYQELSSRARRGSAKVLLREYRYQTLQEYRSALVELFVLSRSASVQEAVEGAEQDILP